jgi:hypothetical protein
MWDATHTGNIVAGVATLVKPGVEVQALGPLTGRLDGDQLVISYFVPPDSIPGFPRCSVMGFGVATATNTSISGRLPLTFGDCAGTGLDRPPDIDLRLTK